jgi:hypothetical protein
LLLIARQSICDGFQGAARLKRNGSDGIAKAHFSPDEYQVEMAMFGLQVDGFWLAVTNYAACMPVTAGENLCDGVVSVGTPWTVIEADNDPELKLSSADLVELRCYFKTNSALGRRILKICPHGSTCAVELALGHNRKNITKMLGADRLVRAMYISDPIDGWVYYAKRWRKNKLLWFVLSVMGDGMELRIDAR